MASVHYLLIIAFFISIPLSCTNVALAARHLLHNSKNVPPLPRPKLPPLPPNLTTTPTASVPTLPSPTETFGPPPLSPVPPSISVLTPPNPPITPPVKVEPPSLPPPTSTSPPKDEAFGPPTLSPAPPSISVLTPPNPPKHSPVTVKPPSLPSPTSTSPPKDETPPSTSSKSPPLPKPISHKLPTFPIFPPVKPGPCQIQNHFLAHPNSHISSALPCHLSIGYQKFQVQVLQTKSITRPRGSVPIIVSLVSSRGSTTCCDCSVGLVVVVIKI